MYLQTTGTNLHLIFTDKFANAQMKTLFKLSNKNLCSNPIQRC